MNSDPYDSAAWRNFGMLDSDESAIFDEAMRHDPLLRDAFVEMNRLSAAIAVSTTRPIQPKIGQLERLQSRLGLTPTRRAYVWLGVSGWAAAAVLALLLVLNHRKPSVNQTVGGTMTPPSMVKPDNRGASPVPVSHSNDPTHDSSGQDVANNNHPKSHDPSTDKSYVGNSPDSKDIAKVETKRLVQEIEVLRENLEKFQRRDRVLFEPTPGMALPVVMTMKPPSATTDDDGTLAKNDEHSPITAMLGDAVKAMNTAPGIGRTSDPTHPDGSGGLMIPEGNPDIAAITPLVTKPGNSSDSTTLTQTSTNTQPTAVPIYDAARDTGTLVVSNLPKTKDGEAYNLWVTTENGTQPIYVGSLPASSASGTDSFDFSLGSTMILPSGFLLTKDLKETPSKPSAVNTVLQGPTPSR